MTSELTFLLFLLGLRWGCYESLRLCDSEAFRHQLLGCLAQPWLTISPGLCNQKTICLCSYLSVFPVPQKILESGKLKMKTSIPKVGRWEPSVCDHCWCELCSGCARELSLCRRALREDATNVLSSAWPQSFVKAEEKAMMLSFPSNLVKLSRRRLLDGQRDVQAAGWISFPQELG